MIRCMMLALTLILITLSAAYLGRDEQLRQVLQRTQLPVESSSYSEPKAAPQYQEQGFTASSSNQQTSTPRFIPDEPISQQPYTTPQTDPQSSSEPLADPSAEAQLFPIENGSEDYIPSPPTEQQKLMAAEPFVKELFELTERGADDLRAIIDQAIGEFLSSSPLERNAAIPALIEKYAPMVTALEADSDGQAEAILLRMKAALVAIGADDGLVNDARAAYEHSKQQQITHYTDIFSAFIPSSSAQ